MNRRELIKSLAAVPVMAGGAAGPRASWSKESGSGSAPGSHRCYTDEWKRTEPDHVLYLPPEPLGDDGDNEHLIVVETPKGDSAGDLEPGSLGDVPRLPHRGLTEPGRRGDLDSARDHRGPHRPPGFTAAFAVPLVSRSGRIYLLFNKHTGVTDMSFTVTALQRCIYSDDDGHTWQEGADLDVRRRPSTTTPIPGCRRT